MIGLKTERLVFRQWREEDYLVIVKFFSNQETSRYVGGVKTKEEAWRLMATYVGHYELMGFSYLAIEEKESGSLIGTVGLWNSTPWPEPELGYWLVPEFQGKGYGVEAGKAVLDYGLNTVQLETLVSYIDSSNEPSKKLALKLGARPEPSIELLDFGLHEVYRHR